MMYRAAKIQGDAVSVPQVLFSRLSAQGADDARFRVALYVLGAAAEVAAADIAAALRLPQKKVDAALSYWEGAGLLEQTAAPADGAAVVAPPAPRRKYTTRDTVRASEENPTLGWLLQEVQRAFGAPVSENDTNIIATLFCADGFPAELILLAAAQAAHNGAVSARYAEKMLFSWRRAGINDATEADRYLKLLAEREVREQELARRMALEGNPFTLAEKKHIASWFETYNYSWDMIDAARLAAGENAGSVKYVSAILKSWHAKGYQTPRQVQQGGENANVRVMRTAAPADDILQGAKDYVPMKRRSSHEA